MRLTSVNTGLVLLSLLFLPANAISQREYGGHFTKERVENLRKNSQSIPSLQRYKQKIVDACKPWIELSDDELWHMIPGQQLPRTIDVTWNYNFPKRARLGCLGCGDDIYNHGAYPYEPDFWEKPWKLTCPSCGVVFPTNDFGAYYKSGIDEKGLFNPEKADRSLLYNAAYPDPAHPLHKYGVDDGYGFIKKEDDGTGKLVDREYKYIAYYTWKYWRHIFSGLNNLSTAYLYTGDKIYAHKAAIILDRIADVYPDMDWKPYGDLGWYHSDGSSRRGKIEGRIWETAQIQTMVRSYEQILSGTVDAPELYAFLKSKAEQYDLPGNKGSRQDLINNIDNGLVKTAAEAVISGYIRGNEGMHQYSVTVCALALNTEPYTSQWLDWVFAEDGGKLPNTIVRLFDRDGLAQEGAPGYCYLWPSKIISIMELLENYPGYTKNKITRDYPQFVNALIAPWRVEILNSFTPNIGDSGATGTTESLARARLMSAGFEFYKNPQAARYAWEANGYTAGDMLIDGTREDPFELNHALEKAALEYPVGPRIGEHMPGFGYAKFEFGGGPAGTARPDGTALWMYYGRTILHGHHDRLNYSIFAYNTDLSPDLGYPEFANALWPERYAWTNNTISHNTVVINKKRQATNWGGYPHFYHVEPGFGVIEVESANVYKEATDYTRTLAFIQAPGSSDAYAVDVFRVAGGNDHLLSFHGPPGPVSLVNLNLDRQTTGTYAGPDIVFGDVSEELPLGYSFLKNVERQQQPPASFQIDWKAEAGYRGVTENDDIHLRMHVVGGSPLSDIALADGVPPQNKPGNPKSIRYALLHREAEGQTTATDGLRSRFVSVIEPWKDAAYIKNVTSLTTPDTDERTAALKIEFENGTVDYIVSNPSRQLVTFDDDSTLKTDGAYAWLRVVSGQVTSATLSRGTLLELNEFKTTGPAEARGIVTAFEKDPKKPATMQLQLTEGQFPVGPGQQIYVENDRVRNACYDIVSAEQNPGQPSHWTITCGPGTFIRSFIDEKDYSKGFAYNIKEGQQFTIPVTVSYSK